MPDKMTIATLQQMKRDGKKSIGVVAWDYQIARIADRAGVDFVSVGDSVGVNLWGRDEVLEVTLDEMLICCQAVRRGTARALVSCDMPFGPVQHGVDSALAAAAHVGALSVEQLNRSLASPTPVGRPSHNLLEWSGSELICKQGHGALSVPEMETSWCESSEWVSQSPSWDRVAST